MSKTLLWFLVRLNLIVWLSAAIAVAVFGPVDAAPLANGPPSVTVCHFGDTITVPQRALNGHIGHGDTLGECPAVEDPLPPTTEAYPLYTMWLLVDDNNWHCLLRSESHPSIERQNALCFPGWTGGTWTATRALCVDDVMSDGSWYCDKYTPWRLR